MRPVMSYLHDKSFTSVIFLDDVLIIGPSWQACVKNIEVSINLLESLGFIINYNKNILKSIQRVFRNHVRFQKNDAKINKE